jgi:hypothetical protein
VLCCAPALTHSQAAQTFMIHGTAHSCSAITQLDSALADNSQQFFTGWNEKDYADASAWAQSCADYGWHVAGRPRIPLLQQQHDRALAAAQSQAAGTATTEAPVAPVAQAATLAVQAAAPIAQAATPAVQTAAPVAQAATPAVQGAAPLAQAAALPAQGAAPPAQAAVAAVQPAVAMQLSTNAASGPNVPPSSSAASELGAASVPGSAAPPAMAAASAPVAASAAAPVQEPMLASAAPGIPLTASAAQTNVAAQTIPASAMVITGGGRVASDPEEESVVTGEYFKKHFHQESLWVANRAHLDIGEDRGPPTWPTSGTSAQLKNRLTADKIVLYCARKTNASETSSRQRTDPDNQPLLWDWRWCEAEEAAAYNRLVTGNEFPSAGRGVVLGCAGSDSYIYTERCIQTLIESARN